MASLPTSSVMAYLWPSSARHGLMNVMCVPVSLRRAGSFGDALKTHTHLVWRQIPLWCPGALTSCKAPQLLHCISCIIHSAHRNTLFLTCVHFARCCIKWPHLEKFDWTKHTPSSITSVAGALAALWLFDPNFIGVKLTPLYSKLH